MSTDAERQRRLYERRRAKGFAATTVWVPKARLPEIRRIAREMREEYEAGDGAAADRGSER